MSKALLKSIKHAWVQRLTNCPSERKAVSGSDIYWYTERYFNGLFSTRRTINHLYRRAAVIVSSALWGMLAQTVTEMVASAARPTTFTVKKIAWPAIQSWRWFCQPTNYPASTMRLIACDWRLTYFYFYANKGCLGRVANNKILMLCSLVNHQSFSTVCQETMNWIHIQACIIICYT